MEQEGKKKNEKNYKKSDFDFVFGDGDSYSFYLAQSSRASTKTGSETGARRTAEVPGYDLSV